MNAQVDNPLSPTEAVELIKDALETADQALDLYNKVLDQIIPWGTFEDTLSRLDQFRDDYSAEAAKLVGKVRTLLADSKDSYFEAVDKVYQWCGTASVLLPTYVNALTDPDPKKAKLQKPLLLQTLKLGVQHIDDGIAKLEAASRSFNEADGELTVLHKRLTEDFDTKSQYFNAQVDKIRKEAYAGAAAGVVAGPFGLIIAYSIAAGVVEGKLIPELKERMVSVKAFFERIQADITKTQTDIAGAKVNLRNEAVSLGELKSQIETTQIFLEIDTDNVLKAEVTEAAMKLSNSCIQYRSRHQSPKEPVKVWTRDHMRQLIRDVARMADPAVALKAA